nr:sugar transferase [Maliibacterium massiliense]
MLPERVQMQEPEAAEDAGGFDLATVKDVVAATRQIAWHVRFFKRLFDIVVSFLLLVMLSPLVLLVSIAIFFVDGVPVIFRQRRVGKDAKAFYIYKFRTMHKNTPKNVPTYELEHPEQFITKCGRFLRATSFDEVPQLFNVLKGDMSMVGPRPLVETEPNIHAMRSARGVYSVKPGMTGWAQVNGRDLISLAEKVDLDAYYVAHLSLGLDARIILRTIKVVLTGAGVAEGKRS